MRRLALYNVKNQDLIDELKKEFTTLDITNKDDNNMEAIFLDWTPSNRKSPLLARQIQVVTHCYAKKIPMMIFDRYLGITTDEYKLFKKAGTIMFEPALNFRTEFTYLPFSIKIKDKENLTINPIDEKRKFSLVYNGDLIEKIFSFEKYILEYHKKFGGVYYSAKIDKGKEQEYFTKLSLGNSAPIPYVDAKCTVILGSIQNYKIGYLDQSFFDALQNNCIPLIPDEHRFFNGFPTTIEKSIDIAMYCNSYESTHFGFIYDIHETIKNKYPEMSLQYTVNMIKYFIDK